MDNFEAACEDAFKIYKEYKALKGKVEAAYEDALEIYEEYKALKGEVEAAQNKLKSDENLQEEKRQDKYHG